MNVQEFVAAAKELGFCDVGFCAPDSFELQRQQVMRQPPLAERRQLKFDPLKENALIKSLAVLLWPYAQTAEPSSKQAVFIDSYYNASNAAYHAAKALEEILGREGHYAKANVSYPAKEAAVRAGLGVVGDHSLLIHPKYGSRIVIILIESDIVVETNHSVARGECLHCGKCAHACPAGAITESGMMHPEKCLRNFMMEGIVVPEQFRRMMGNRLLGCDLCQRVCPLQPSKEERNAGMWQIHDFVTNDPEVFSLSVKQLANEIGRNAARAQRVRAQIALLCGNKGGKEALDVLQIWANSDFEAVREHALWAIKEILDREMQLQESPDAGLDQTT